MLGLVREKPKNVATSTSKGAHAKTVAGCCLNGSEYAEPDLCYFLVLCIGQNWKGKEALFQRTLDDATGQRISTFALFFCKGYF